MAVFQTVPYNFTGGTYQSRSRSVSSQLTLNMYQHYNELGKDPYVLYSFPGQKYVSEVTGSVDRNKYNMNEVLYSVVDNKLYSTDSAGFSIALGIVTGSGRCIFAGDGDNLVIVCDRVYVYTVSNGIFQENTNVNLVNVLSVTILKSQFIYTTEDLSFISSPNDPFTVSGLNAIGAESSPDKLVRDYAFNQTLYRFGVRTTEPWYFSGVGSPPIDVIEGQQFSVGLAATNSVANTDKALYWLGDDKAIYRVSGNIEERISDDGISNAIELMSKIDDAYGYTFTLQGLDFYFIAFPSENKSFILNEQLGKNGWGTLSSTNYDSIYSGTSSISIYGKTYIGAGGKLFTLELDEYTQDSDTMLRQRIGLPITRKNMGQSGIKGRAVMLSRIEFVIEQGIGLITGQGENPRMLLELSTDGGRSYAHSQWVRLGRMGEHTLNVQADMMIVGDEIVPKITLSDPVPLTISSVLIDIKAVPR